MNNPRFKRSTNHFFYSSVHVSIPWSKTVPSDLAHFLDHELFIDLQKALIGACAIKKVKNTDNCVTFIVKGIMSVNHIMKTIKESYRYVYEIEIPLCLYHLKKELYKKCSHVMHKTKSVIYVQITNKVVFFIGGRMKDVVNCRLEILKIIDEFLGYHSEIVHGEYDLYQLINKGLRVSLGSFIDSNLLLISTKNGINLLQSENQSSFFEMIHLDTLKYTWILLYRRHKLNDILAQNSTYLNVIDFSSKITKIMFMSLSKTNLKKSLNFFRELYNSIVIANFSEPIYQKMNSLIIFDNGENTYSTIVGEIDDIKKVVPDGDNDFEAFIDIEGETLDFMCGKKNGKIIKIMKGLGCTIEVTRRKGFEKSHVFIKGRLSVFKVALSMVYSEFPSHINFDIDSKYHKGIIGYGGKNIQKMMKKHGVYIKFMSQSEMKQEGYAYNVLIKTPKKNESNLKKMKNELFEAIEESPDEEKKWREVSGDQFYTFRPKDFSILFDKFLVVEKLPKVYWYNQGNKSNVICGMEEKVNCSMDKDYMTRGMGDNMIYCLQDRITHCLKDNMTRGMEESMTYCSKGILTGCSKDITSLTSNTNSVYPTYTLVNDDVFILTPLLMNVKPITVGHWLIVVPEESSMLYVFTVSRMRIIYKVFEEMKEDSVIECKFLI